MNACTCTGFAPSARLFTRPDLIGIRVWLGLGLGGGLESELKDFGVSHKSISEEVCDKMKIAARPCRLPRAPVNRAANGGDQPCGFNLASNK
jgi:hypothetical protein